MSKGAKYYNLPLTLARVARGWHEVKIQCFKFWCEDPKDSPFDSTANLNKINFSTVTDQTHTDQSPIPWQNNGNTAKAMKKS